MMKSETKNHDWSRVWVLTVVFGKPVAWKWDDPKQRFNFDNDADANSWLTDWRMSGMEVFDDRGRHTANVWN